MAQRADTTLMRRFVGTWRAADGFSDLDFTVKVRRGAFHVSCVDRSDGEAPEIYGITWSAKRATLRFSAHWPSTGRFTKYSVMPSLIENRLEVSFTYSAQELWERAEI